MVSSDYRITQQGMSNRAVANMQQTLQKLQQLQSEVASNKRIQRPSDDPVGTISALRLRNNIDQSGQIGRNITDATGWLGTADDALNSVVQQVQHIRDLALQAQNGTLGASELGAIADEMDSTRSSLIDLANSKYGNRAVFAGTATGSAYDTSGNYMGHSAVIERTVGPGTRVQINVNGDAVFGPNGSDLFSAVAQLSSDVRAGNTAAIAADMQTLDAHTQTVQSNLGAIGAREQGVTAMKNRNDSSAISLQSGLSDVEDVDLPKALMDMQIQQTAYQAALATTARVIQPSLVDFLK